MPRTVPATAVLVPVASRPTRTILFCAVNVPATNIIPFTTVNVLLEEMARLCTRFRAMRFVPLVGPLK